jgi:shikimate dehydrogenase
LLNHHQEEFVVSLAQPITGKTSITGLIGWPVSHSVSPPMHNAAFAHLGLDWCYIPLPVSTEPSHRIGNAVAGLRALGLRGANVTVPHKQSVIPYLDTLTPAAQAIGAVNTIVVGPDGLLTGDNTDALGFIADLRAHKVDPSGSVALILGAGGSARAVAYGLATAGVSSLAIANRSPARAQELVTELAPLVPAGHITAHDMGTELPELSQRADLIVNCTSLGMTPYIETSPWPDQLPFQPHQTVYDLVYNPTRTRFLTAAERAGATAIGGLGMLIWQGAVAFELWTGQPAPVPVMSKTVFEIMARRR